MWVGKEYMLEFGCVICFSVYFYIRVINQVLIVYKDAAGMWHEDRFRPLCTALTNLILNLIFVQFMGIYGVLLSTVLSTLFVGMPWVIKNIFTVVLKRDFREYIKKLLLYVCAAICGWAITYALCLLVRGSLIVVLAIRVLLCIIICNCFYIMVFHNKDEFKQTIKLIDGIVGRKLPFAHSFLMKLLFLPNKSEKTNDNQ